MVHSTEVSIHVALSMAVIRSALPRFEKSFFNTVTSTDR